MCAFCQEVKAKGKVRKFSGVSPFLTGTALAPYMRAGEVISASAKPLVSSCLLLAGSEYDFAWLSGDRGKHHVVVGQLGTGGTSKASEQHGWQRSWYLAHAKALSAALSPAYFKSLGLPTLEDEG